MGKKNRGAAVASAATEEALLRHPTPEDTLVGDASELEEIADTVKTEAIVPEVVKPRGRTSTGPKAAIKLLVDGVEYEYWKPGKIGTMKSDLGYIASHTNPPLNLQTVGEEYVKE